MTLDSGLAVSTMSKNILTLSLASSNFLLSPYLANAQQPRVENPSDRLSRSSFVGSECIPTRSSAISVTSRDGTSLSSTDLRKGR